jgi:integrator complex subunit 9
MRPSVVLAPHPSLRLGDAPTLLRHWRDDARSLLLLTSPVSDEDLLLAPFLPLAIEVGRCPIDARASRLTPHPEDPSLELALERLDVDVDVMMV